MSKKLLNIILSLSLLSIPSGYVYNGIPGQIDGIYMLPRINLLLAPIAAIFIYAVGIIIGRKNKKTYKFFNAIMLFLIPCIFALTYFVIRDTLALLLTSTTGLIVHMSMRGGLNCFALFTFNESAIRFNLNENKIDRRNKIFGNSRNGEFRYIYIAPSYESWKIQQQKCAVTFALAGIVMLCQSIFALSLNWKWLLVSLILICIGYCRFGATEQPTCHKQGD